MYINKEGYTILSHISEIKCFHERRESWNHQPTTKKKCHQIYHNVNHNTELLTYILHQVLQLYQNTKRLNNNKNYKD